MNIDVREYLRINPISVHELTLSGDGRDCFLYFPADHDQTCNHDPKVGYEIMTQNAMFYSIYQSIFQDLIDENIRFRATVELSEQGSPIITWQDGIHLSATQFTNYIRRPVWEAFHPGFEERVNSLLSKVNQKIAELMRQAKLYYIGAFEPQSSLLRKSGWRHSNNEPIYSSFDYSEGQLWCVEGGKTVPEGEDEAIIGSETLKHSHVPTKAEAMTASFSKNQGGGQLVGQFRIGNNSLVSQDAAYKAGGVNMEIMQEDYSYSADPHDGKLTYPLYGQNVLDFRTRDRSHNNVPPSLNIYARYFGFSEQRANQQMEKETQQAAIRQAPEPVPPSMSRYVKLREYNASEPQYQSLLVTDLLDSYVQNDLTDHDYLLRMSLDGQEGGNVKLMKQTVQMFLDIFVEDAELRLGRAFKYQDDKEIGDYIEKDGKWVKNLRGFVTIAQIIKQKLDEELFQKIEFTKWYNDQLEVLAEIQNKIELIKDLVKSMKPLNYAGRIIISVTDDTEQKVIKNYGGKKWKRITNFLRGVRNDDSSKEVGERTGEEYVCLRQSNVPIHSHHVALSNPSTTNPAAWMVKGRGGDESKIVNGTEIQSEDTDRMVDGLSNVSLEYQLSPLEYERRSQITVPHDNMPPYKEVYIWECLEATDEEMEASGEPTTVSYTITWDENGGEPHEQPWTGFAYGQTLESYGSLPVPVRTGYTFQHWSDRYGGTVSLRDIVTGDAKYTAQWKLNAHTIRFHSNGGYFPGKTGDTSSIGRKWGQQIGKFPTAVRDKIDDGDKVTSYELAGWRDSQGQTVAQDRVVDGDIDCYAQWNQLFRRYITIELNANNGDDGDFRTKRTLEGNTIGRFYEPSLVGHSIIGWFTDPVDGEQVHEGTVVSDDSTFYAHWKPNEYSIIWSPQNGNPTEVKSVPYGQPAINYCPESLERTGYTFAGWFNDPVSGEQLTDADVVTQAATYYAHWTPNEYIVYFNPGVGTVEHLQKSVVFGQPYGVLPNAARTGYNLDGWFTLETAEGDKVEAGNTVLLAEDHTLYAHWTPRKYTITWDAQGGSTVRPWVMDYDSPLGGLPTSYLEDNGLIGWFTEPSGGTEIDELTMVEGDATYYAHWSEVNYTVEYSGNGETSGSTPSSSHFYEVPSRLSQNQFTRQYAVTFNGNGGSPAAQTAASDYQFQGWALDPNGQAQYSDQQTVSDLSSTKDAVVTLFAVWNPTPMELPSILMEGYAFLGWYTEQNGGTKIGDAGDTYQPAADTQLWAHWTANTYTITFDANGGTPESQTMEVTFDQPVGNLPSATFDGKTFLGWFYDDTDESEQLLPTTPYAIAGNHTYFAHWEDVSPEPEIETMP